MVLSFSIVIVLHRGTAAHQLRLPSTMERIKK